MTLPDDLERETPPIAEATDSLDSSGVDAANEAEARAIIERLLPDPSEREILLNVLGDSILAAHAAGASKWGVTLYPNRIWLNVGRIVVCNIQRKRGWLSLIKDRVSNLEQLERDGLLTKGYKSFPASVGIEFPPEIDPAIVQSVKTAHAALVQEAANQVRQLRGPTVQAHSNGTMAYLRTTLQRELPDPAYAGSLHRPLRRMPPNVWIFQANPDQYNFATDLHEGVIGKQNRWAVTSYRQEIHAGDKVLFWQSGKSSGIYALGELLSDPYQRDWQPDEQALKRQPYLNAQWWVDYRYTRVLDRPLMRSTIKAHVALGQMDIFKNPMGTNFRVLPQEWSELAMLLDLPPRPEINVRDLLHQQLTARGLHFTSWQIATFYTALQAKGFVILSGISGTGKTKLAQHFAELLPQPGATAAAVERADEQIAITLKPYMFKYNRLIIPKQATRFFDPPKPGESKDVELTFDDQSQVCRLTHAEYGDTDYVALMLRGSAVKWFKQTFKPDDTLTLEPEFDAKQDLVGFRLANGTNAASSSDQGDNTPANTTNGTSPTTASEAGANWLFIPVRPDWRDSKSLLGYFNPLTGAYVWTDFLRFLVRAAQSYRSGERLAWFVILDEMNLARVEYYFADLLSVLESGRTPEGWSREALRLDYPTTSDGDLPPRELRLPPNLAFVGTVNVDETTHAFSPKVLDRAFTIEFVEADFTAYPPGMTTTSPALTPELKHDILRRFSQDGQFPRVAKERISAYVDEHPEVRDHLQSLNTLLQPYSMHFGFRVFDEIVAFLATADENGLFDDLGDATAAFDAAVLMKVLPKFHGSRGKLEAPLRAVLAWCVNPLAPDIAPIASKLDQCESGQAAMLILNQQTYLYPRTAARVSRMVWALYTDGFASFG